MRPPLALVQPGTCPTPPALPVHPDTRAAAVLRAAWAAGHDTGERTGHVHGWRQGLVCGLCWGALLTALGVAAAIAAGWL